MRDNTSAATSFKRLEKIVRGFSNHRRLQLIYLLNDNPDIELTRLAGLCAIGLPTATEHCRRLEVAGLISKRKDARKVLHALTPLGKKVIKFIETL